jgi:hypothetical protein
MVRTLLTSLIISLNSSYLRESSSHTSFSMWPVTLLFSMWPQRRLRAVSLVIFSLFQLFEIHHPNRVVTSKCWKLQMTSWGVLLKQAHYAHFLLWKRRVLLELIWRFSILKLNRSTMTLPLLSVDWAKRATLPASWQLDSGGQNTHQMQQC